jgi:hypothetical protein
MGRHDKPFQGEKRLAAKTSPLRVRRAAGLGVASDTCVIFFSLPPRATVAGFPVLMSNDNDSDAGIEAAVYD